MTEGVTIEMLGEPRGKGRPRFSRKTGRAYTPGETRSYEGALRYAAQAAMAGRAPMEGPLTVDVTARFPVPKSWSKKKRADALAGLVRPTSRPDWENIAKMLDAFNEVVWRDDAQVVAGRIRKIYSERPALLVVVAALVANLPAAPQATLIHEATA